MVLAVFNLFSIDVVYQFELMNVVVLVNKVIVFYFN